MEWELPSVQLSHIMNLDTILPLPLLKMLPLCYNVYTLYWNTVALITIIAFLDLPVVRIFWHLHYCIPTGLYLSSCFMYLSTWYCYWPWLLTPVNSVCSCSLPTTKNSWDGGHPGTEKVDLYPSPSCTTLYITLSRLASNTSAQLGGYPVNGQ